MEVLKTNLQRLGRLTIVVVGIGLVYYAVKRSLTLQEIVTEPKVLHYQVDASSDSLRFLVVGDTGSGDNHQLMVAKAMEERCQRDHYEGLIFLGDNFYPHGVKSTEDPQWQSKFEQPYSSPCLQNLPVFAILGNHDYKGNIAAQIAYTQKNPRWQMPHRFYAIEFGDLVRLTVFDSSYPDLCFSANHCAVDFLKKSLEDSQGKAWKIVLAHHPLISSSKQGSSHNGSGVLARLLRSQICKAADVWFSGHAHHLEIQRLPSCQTDFIVSGGGGGPRQKVQSELTGALFATPRHGFVDLQVEFAQLRYEFVSEKGESLFTTEKRRSRSVARSKP